MTPITLIAGLIAIAVPIMAIYLIFALDLFGTGKGSTVFICLGWGIVAFGLALVVNQQIYNVFQNAVIIITIVAPIIEEILKSLILVYFVTQPRFRYIVDGAIYGFAVGIGFAVVENLFYIQQHLDSNTLTLAISRVLSASLMHATADAMIGIAFGHLRRSQSRYKGVWALGGILTAITIHATFNNLTQRLEGIPLLLVAVGMGVGGGIVIGLLINKGLTEEKKRFEATLGLNVGVSSRERKAVQQLGSSNIDTMLNDLGLMFGTDKVPAIRRLLVIQGNMGILQNNLAGQASPRLRKAWEEEQAKLRAENDQIRNELGTYIMSFLRSTFPPDDTTIRSAFNREFEKHDPTAINSFDAFIVASKIATFTPEELEANADLLKKVEFFKDVPIADLENLSRALVARTYTEGQILFNQGDAGDSMFLVKTGTINIVNAIGSEERLLHAAGAGEVVGELALLDEQPRSAKARAGSALTVLMLDGKLFTQFLQSRPQVILAVLQFLAQKVRNVTDVVEKTITWAGHVAQGELSQAEAVGRLLPAGTVPAPAAVIHPTSKSSIFDTISPSTSRVGGSFQTLGLQLEKREEGLQQKFADAGMSEADIAALPAHQKQVIECIVKDPMTALQGLTLDMLKSKLPEIDNLPAVLTELTKSGWLVATGSTNVRYRPNLTRKRKPAK